MAKRRAIVVTLVRAGATSWCEADRLRGATDLPLTDDGRAQVAAATATLLGRHIAAIHHPPDEAATESARLVARRVGGRVRSHDDLADPDLGILEGLSEADFAERYAKRRKQWAEDPLALVPPEGEPFADARERLVACAAHLIGRARSGEAGIVVHRIAWGLLRSWLADTTPGRAWDAPEAGVERYLVPRSVL